MITKPGKNQPGNAAAREVRRGDSTSSTVLSAPVPTSNPIRLSRVCQRSANHIPGLTFHRLLGYVSI
jgi:hypothetical protein